MQRATLVPILIALVLPAVLAQTVDIRPGIVYDAAGGQPLKLDLYRPPGPGPHPLVVVMHGGGWIGGLRDYGDPVILARALVREGIAAASISYRLAPRAVFPAQLADCRNAVQFLRLHAASLRIDPERVAAAGASSGGHLAALLATTDDAADPEAEDRRLRQSTRLRCAIAICAPLVLEPDPSEAPPPAAIGILTTFLGVKPSGAPDDLERALALAARASPGHHVSPDDPPILLIHGMKDGLVLPSQSRRMAAILDKAGVPAPTVFLDDGGHCDFLFDYGARWRQGPHPFWEPVREFLRQWLLPVVKTA